MYASVCPTCKRPIRCSPRDLTEDGCTITLYLSCGELFDMDTHYGRASTRPLTRERFIEYNATHEQRVEMRAKQEECWRELGQWG
jgi:hypothetical protein